MWRWMSRAGLSACATLRGLGSYTHRRARCDHIQHDRSDEKCKDSSMKSTETIIEMWGGLGIREGWDEIEGQGGLR